MLLVIEEEVKKSVGLLNQLDPSVAREFCLTALDFLNSGINRRVYASAAGKLHLDEESVGQAIESIMFIMSQAAKFMLSEADLKNSLVSLSLAEPVQQELVEWYSTNRTTLRSVLTRIDRRTGSVPHVTGLEWRLEGTVATRAVRDQADVEVVLRLELDDRGKKKFVTLRCDVANLLHLRDQMELALAEARSLHVQKIARHVK